MKQRIPTLDDFTTNENIRINESAFDITVRKEAEDFTDKQSELTYVKNFKWMPKVEPVVVVSCSASIIDDVNTQVLIHLSNNDKIYYQIKESRTPGKGQNVPPFYTTELNINGLKLESDLDWFDEYNNGSILGAVLSYYENWKNKK